MDYGSSFDVLDNPYVEFVAYRMTNGPKGQLRLEDDYQLEKCQAEFLDQFVPEDKKAWYPQALCFKDRDNVNV